MNRRKHRPAVRLIAAVGGALTIAGLSACAPITTLTQYAASDGVRVVVSDEITLENLMILSAAQGELGAVQGAITNDGDAATTVSIADQVFNLAAGETLLLGGENGLTFTLASVAVAPGATLPVVVSGGDGTPQEVPVPVLDGTIAPYDQFVPTS